MPATRDGVRTRDRMPRNSSWRGGSIWKMVGGRSVASVSMSVPHAEEKLLQSDRALLTSCERLSIQ